MFTKKDYRTYFTQLLEIEHSMEKDAIELHTLIKDPETRRLLIMLRDDERRHAKIVEEMIALIR